MDKRTFLKISALAGAGAMIKKVGIANVGNEEVRTEDAAKRIKSLAYDQVPDEYFCCI